MNKAPRLKKLVKSFLTRSRATMVQVLPEGKWLEVSSGKTILEEALNKGFEFPHGCTVGTCGSCKCKILEGKVRELSDFAFTLSEEELAKGYILACQAQPKGGRLKIELDDGLNQAPPFCARVVKKEPLTHDILAVRIELDRPIAYRPGQFALIRSHMLDRDRCYSFAEGGSLDGQTQVTFFIRKVPGGQFTEKLFANDLDDKDLTLYGPAGGFYLRPGRRPMLCVCGGSGLAPILSILEDAAKRRIDRDCIVLFGVKSKADIYGVEFMRRVSQQWAGVFSVRYLVENESDCAELKEEGLPVECGLVTDGLERTFEEFGQNVKGIELYMAGPPGMIDAAIKMAKDKGVHWNDIHFDRFTDASHSG